MNFDNLVNLILEQTPYTPPQVQASKPGETLPAAAERMAKNMFAGAYSDWQAKQTGSSYPVTNILHLIPTFNGKPLLPAEINQFKVNVTNGKLKSAKGSQAFGLPYHLWVATDFMSDKPASIVIESPKYKSIEPIIVKEQVDNEPSKEQYVPVQLK